MLSLAVGVLTPSGIPIIHNRIPLSRPCRREIPGSLAEAVPFALLVFSCFGVPLVSAATPHLAQQFRSIIDAFPFVNTLFGNWSTNFQIGSPGPVFSLVNPRVAAYNPLESPAGPLLTPCPVHPTFPGGLHLLSNSGRARGEKKEGATHFRKCDAPGK